MRPKRRDTNLVRDYWPQLTTIVAVLLLLGQMYSDFNTLKQELRDSQAVQAKQWAIFNDKIDKAMEVLNEEDDGITSDYRVADEHLQQNIDNVKKYEELRSEKDKLEIKVWHYEHH